MSFSVHDAVRALAAGEVVVVPTDTVYGLAADPTRRAAVERIYALKGRDETKPLAVLGTDVAQLEGVGRFGDAARRLVDAFWPGPLTIVVERAPRFDADLGGTDSQTVAVRVPDRPVCLELLAATGPLAVTSANRSGEEPATTAAEARGVFPGVEVLDDGDCNGVPSTVVSVIGEPQILRPGPLEREILQMLAS